MDGRLKDFEDFFIITYTLMFNYCLHHGQKYEDADEIVNGAFSRMWVAWEKCSSLNTNQRKKWLFNTIDNIIRERNKKKVLQIMDIDNYTDILADEVNNEIAGLFENFNYDIYVNRIHELLSTNEWELFNLKIIKEQTYEEAASELGRSVDVVYVQMTRIREKIRKHKDEIFG